MFSKIHIISITSVALDILRCASFYDKWCHLFWSVFILEFINIWPLFMKHYESHSKFTNYPNYFSWVQSAYDNLANYQQRYDDEVITIALSISEKFSNFSTFLTLLTTPTTTGNSVKCQKANGEVKTL